MKYGSSEGEMRSRIDNPPSVQSSTGFFGGQPLAAHCFLSCQCFQPAQASKAKVTVANMGRYGSMATKAEAEPRPSSTTTKGPMQQADARPPARTAPISGALLFDVVGVFDMFSMPAV